jgi:hypothetical protein
MVHHEVQSWLYIILACSHSFPLEPSTPATMLNDGGRARFGYVRVAACYSWARSGSEAARPNGMGVWFIQDVTQVLSSPVLSSSPKAAFFLILGDAEWTCSRPGAGQGRHGSLGRLPEWRILLRALFCCECNRRVFCSLVFPERNAEEAQKGWAAWLLDKGGG